MPDINSLVGQVLVSEGRSDVFEESSSFDDIDLNVTNEQIDPSTFPAVAAAKARQNKAAAQKKEKKSAAGTAALAGAAGTAAAVGGAAVHKINKMKHALSVSDLAKQKAYNSLHNMKRALSASDLAKQKAQQKAYNSLHNMKRALSASDLAKQKAQEKLHSLQNMSGSEHARVAMGKLKNAVEEHGKTALASVKHAGATVMDKIKDHPKAAAAIGAGAGLAALGVGAKKYIAHRKAKKAGNN